MPPVIMGLLTLSGNTQPSTVYLFSSVTLNLGNPFHPGLKRQLCKMSVS